MLVILAIYLPALISILAITLAVLLHNPRALVTKMFTLSTLSIMAWMSCLFLADLIGSLETAITLFKISTLISVLIPASFVAFTTVFPKRKPGKARLPLWVIFLPSILFFIVGLFDDLVTETTQLSVGIEASGVTAIYNLYSIYFTAYILLGLILLVRKLKYLNTRERNQSKYLIFGVGITAFINVVLNFILVLLPDQSIISIFTAPSFAILVVLVGIAIVRHRLFDIRLIIARSVAYILLIITLGGAYTGLLFAVSQKLFGTETISITQQVVNIILAVFIAFTFQPLRRFFEKFTDGIFYRDRYDTQVVLNNINSILTSQIDLEIITDASLKAICENLRLVGGRFVVLDEDKIYQESHYGQTQPTRFKIRELLELRQNLVIADEMEASPIKEVLVSHGLAVSLRLKTQEGVVGYILLGPKQNGSIYVDQDIKLLEILGNELAIAVQNARSFEKIADFNVTLQKRIEEATRRLRVQNRKLKELDEAKDEFISMASHQLRTPLTSVKGYLSMLTEGDGGKLTKKQFDFADNAYVSAQRMVFLISDMLNVSRINTGKLVIEKAPIDLDVIVKDEIKQLQRSAESRNVKLSYSPPTEKLPRLSLDEGKMRQVIMNFIDNAIYYAPNTAVEVKLEIVEHKVRFSVVDHGIGVPKEAQKHLFTKFYRAGNAQKARPDGTGLGLFMAKMVVEMQGGSILFHSEEGKGSTFGFEFPLELVQASSTAATTKAATAAGQTALPR